MDLFVPGTHNDWRHADPEARAEMDGNEHWVYTCRLPQGVHRFRFVMDGEGPQDWGCAGTERLVPPSGGELVPDGTDVLLNAVDGGTFVFTVDEARNCWSVEGGASEGAMPGEPAPPPPGLPLSAEDIARLQARLAGPPMDSGLPWVGPDGRVLFACRAQAWEHVGVATSWRGWEKDPVALSHVPGTEDLHVGVATAPRGVHAYKIVYNGSYWAKDPANPWVSPDRIPVPKFHLGTFNSVLAVEASPLSTGDTFLGRTGFRSGVMENARDVWVWLPPSYATDPERRYPTLYLLDGNEVITRTFPHDAVREAVGLGEAEECILVCVAFAAQNERLYEFSDPVGRDRYAGFFVRELVPYIDATFRTRPEPGARGMAGVSLGANFSYYIGLRHSDVFGCVAGQGGAWSSGGWELRDLFEYEPVAPLRLYMDSSLPAHPGGEDDASQPSLAMEVALVRRGYRVRHVQHVGEEHDWPSWKNRLPSLVRWFAGPRSA